MLVTQLAPTEAGGRRQVVWKFKTSLDNSAGLYFKVNMCQRCSSVLTGTYEALGLVPNNSKKH